MDGADPGVTGVPRYRHNRKQTPKRRCFREEKRQGHTRQTFDTSLKSAMGMACHSWSGLGARSQHHAHRFRRASAHPARALTPRGALAVGVVVGAGSGLLALEGRSEHLAVPTRPRAARAPWASATRRCPRRWAADKDFFEVASSPPSAIFLLGNNSPCRTSPSTCPRPSRPGLLPHPLGLVRGRADRRRCAPGWAGKEGEFTNTGCSDPALVAAMNWFDKDSPDPAKNGSIVYDTDVGPGLALLRDGQVLPGARPAPGLGDRRTTRTRSAPTFQACRRTPRRAARLLHHGQLEHARTTTSPAPRP